MKVAEKADKQADENISGQNPKWTELTDKDIFIVCGWT